MDEKGRKERGKREERGDGIENERRASERERNT